MPGQHEKIVGKSVDIDEQVPPGLFGGFRVPVGREGDDPPLGPAADRSGHVGPGGRRAPAGEDEAFEGGKPGVHPVHGAFEEFDPIRSDPGKG